MAAERSTVSSLRKTADALLTLREYVTIPSSEQVSLCSAVTFMSSTLCAPSEEYGG